jgi:hypothetical protein
MGNPLLPGKHNLPISLAFDLARLGFEAWMVIGMRLPSWPWADRLPRWKRSAW